MSFKKISIFLLVACVIFVFIQSLFFKFTGSKETVIIFTTISNWMKTVGLESIAPLFASKGAYAVGAAELLASLLLLFSKTRRVGALLGLAIISGAIFFHLGTPLGIDRVVDANGNTDGGVLFYMACAVWISCALLFLLCKKEKRQSRYRR